MPSEGGEREGSKRRKKPRLDDAPTIREYENLIKWLRREAMKKPTIDNVLPLVVALTGCRISECLELTTTDIDSDNGVLHIKTLKGGKGAKRVVPVPTWLFAILERYILYNGVGYKLFPISRTHAWRIIKQKTGKRPHALRHAYGMYMLFKGLDIETARRLMGHSSWDMVKHYVSTVGIDVKLRNPFEDL